MDVALTVLLLATLAFVAGTLWANLRLSSRLRAATRLRPGWSAAACEAALVQEGIDPAVARAALGALAPFYGSHAVPHPDDGLADLPAIDGDDVEDAVASAWDALSLPEPSTTEPERIPALMTVADLARYLDARRRDLTR